MSPKGGVRMQAGVRAISVANMLAVREFASDVRASRMSLAWPVLYPLLYALLIVLIRPYFGSVVSASPVQFGAFVFIGMCLWQSWMDTLRRQMGAIRSNKSMVTRGELGIPTLFLSSAIYGAIELLLKLAVIIPVTLLVFETGVLEVMGFVAVSLLLVLNGALIGTILQPFATLSPDLAKGVQSVSLALLLTGAVFIPLPSDPSSAIVAVLGLNPMGALLSTARSLLTGQAFLVPVHALVWGAVTLLALPLIPRLGRRVLPIVVERLGS